MKGKEFLMHVAVFLIALIYLVLGFFSGYFLGALSASFFNVGADIFGLTVAAIVPSMFFALILYMDRKREKQDIGSFFVGFIVGFAFIVFLLPFGSLG